jgi:hypothetical protein
MVIDGGREEEDVPAVAPRRMTFNTKFPRRNPSLSLREAAVAGQIHIMLCKTTSTLGQAQ